MTKETVSVRLESETIAELDQEAAEQGFGARGEFIRWIIANRDAISEDEVNQLIERVNELERRVDRLEDAE